MFQQLINLIKLEAVTNFCINAAEQNILEICKSVSYEVFKNSLLKFIRPSNNLFNVSDSLGIKLLTRLRLGLSHLREHNFNHNFQDTINLCSRS